MHAPRFDSLSHAECASVLARNHVGRIAYAFRDRVDIEPIHYAYASGWLAGRTAPGSKLTTLLHHRWVAFEVDEIEGPFDWQSVVVHGTVDFVEPDSPHERAVFDHALARLREHFPATFTPDDPTPFRTVVFRIHINEIAGRSARTA
jgi:uncharacterized protein